MSRYLTILLLCLPLLGVAQDCPLPHLPDSVLANYQYPPGTIVTGDFPRMSRHSTWSWGSGWEETVNGPAPWYATYAERQGWHNNWGGFSYSSDDTVQRVHVPGPDSVGRWQVYNVEQALTMLVKEVEFWEDRYLDLFTQSRVWRRQLRASHREGRRGARLANRRMRRQAP